MMLNCRLQLGRDIFVYLLDGAVRFDIARSGACRGENLLADSHRRHAQHSDPQHRPESSRKSNDPLHFK